MHCFNPRNVEPGAGRSLSSRSFLSTQPLPGQPGLHTGTLPQKKTTIIWRCSWDYFCWACGDGSAMKCPCCPCRGPELISQHKFLELQLQGFPKPLLGLMNSYSLQFVVGRMKMRTTRDVKQSTRPLHSIIPFWKTVLSLFILLTWNRLLMSTLNQMSQTLSFLMCKHELV